MYIYHYQDRYIYIPRAPMMYMDIYMYVCICIIVNLGTDTDTDADVKSECIRIYTLYILAYYHCGSRY